ncbi:hypothetical protein PsorP6_008642 [Peronosclerospora sorghi]|uniref:Uncharacterized protein n=1 Tax=Peronosclerospora sorghi TaxID=230839 RepID=A0ACC0W9W5_9STRA|nr:hypothetical protein PsorP6_008642 [Peronosclerospora sorghi]
MIELPCSSYSTSVKCFISMIKRPTSTTEKRIDTPKEGPVLMTMSRSLMRKTKASSTTDELFTSHKEYGQVYKHKVVKHVKRFQWLLAHVWWLVQKGSFKVEKSLWFVHRHDASNKRSATATGDAEGSDNPPQQANSFTAAQAGDWEKKLERAMWFLRVLCSARDIIESQRYLAPRTRKIPKSTEMFDRILHLYGPIEFRQIARMNREMFVSLTRLIEHHPTSPCIVSGDMTGDTGMTFTSSALFLHLDQKSSGLMCLIQGKNEVSTDDCYVSIACLTLLSSDLTDSVFLPDGSPSLNNLRVQQLRCESASPSTDPTDQRSTMYLLRAKAFKHFLYFIVNDVRRRALESRFPCRDTRPRASWRTAIGSDCQSSPIQSYLVATSLSYAYCVPLQKHTSGVLISAFTRSTI